MDIDNSAVGAWFTCPLKFYERYVKGIEPVQASDALLFGSRMHALLAQRLDGRPSGAPLADELEAEAQEMFGLYEAHWGPEPWIVLDVERVFRMPLSDKHNLTGKLDAVVRVEAPQPWAPTPGLYVLEHKTERSGGRDNTPEAWANRRQVGIYQAAVERLYGAPAEGIILDVLTRRSPKGRTEPGFYRGDPLHRSPLQVADALASALWVAEQAERGVFVKNQDNCVGRFGWKCEFLPLHNYGPDNVLVERTLFKPAVPYLTEGTEGT